MGIEFEELEEIATSMAFGRGAMVFTGPRSQKTRTETCLYGHERTTENTAWRKRGGHASKRYPVCRTCQRIRENKGIYKPRAKK